MTQVMSNHVLVRLEMVLVLVQDRCMVCFERTIGSEMVLDAPNGTPRRRSSTGSSLQSVMRVLILMSDRCTVCAERTIGSEIILDAPDGTPR